jgi:transitional endoplasmic reticulum ATPase
LKISLKVHDAYGDDVGRGVVRVDYDIIDKLVPIAGLRPEFQSHRAVKIRNQKGARTYAKCVPLYPSDEGKGIARLDDVTRDNAGVNLGDTVELRKANLYNADVVTAASLEIIPPLSDGYLTEAMESILVKKEDKIRIPYFAGRLTFKILEVVPAPTSVLEAAICSLRTKFKLHEEFHGSTTIG